MKIRLTLVNDEIDSTCFYYYDDDNEEILELEIYNDYRE